MLFTPVKINKLTLRNRIIMPAMVTGYAAVNGEVTDKLIHYHAERAKGGCGLSIVEATYVELGGNCYARGLGASADFMIRGLSQLAAAVHAHGGKVALQLMHGGRLANPATSGQPRHLVSYIPGLTSYEESRILDFDEIDYIIECFKLAASRAVRAGFDAIELHGAHGYLIAQFMSPYTNKRDDMYGGSFENRMRFPLRVSKAVRDAVGLGFPILFRYSVEEFVPGGVTLEMAKDIARVMVDNGVDALNVSAGLAESNQYTIPSGVLAKGWLSDRAKAVKQAIQSRVPVAVVGRINDRQTAEGILVSGKADLVAIGRALLADPYLPIKIVENRDREIRPCVACNLGCIGKMSVGITCAVNPRTGNEAHYPATKAEKRRRIAVVGGGPAGMQAALTAAERGHEVTLYEKSDRLGGLIKVARLLPHKDTYTPLVSYYEYALPNAGVRVVLNREATAEEIRSFSPDVTFVATGSVPIMPDFCLGTPAVTAEAVLMGAPTGHKILILGGGYIGSETAELLADQGREVTIVEMRENIALDMEPRTRKFLLPRLKELNVRVMLRTEVVGITFDKRVKVRNRYRVESWLEGFDTLIVSLGYKAHDPLCQELDAQGINLVAVGDCVKPGKIMDAIHAGFQAGCGN